MTTVQVIVANPSDWVPSTNVIEMNVSNRRSRPSPGFEYEVRGLLEDTLYRVFIKLEQTDANKHKYYKEQNSWFPHCVATKKEAIFEEHEAGLQKGEYWNEQVIQFKNLFISTKMHNSGAMVVESLRRYRASISIQNENVTKPDEGSAKKDEEMEPAMKKARTCEVVVAHDDQHTQQFDNRDGYYDWQYNLQPEAHQIAEEAKENVQPMGWIQEASSNLLEEDRHLLSDFFVLE